MIDHSDGGLMVWDLGTRSGTFINGDRVSPNAPLFSGDEISFGRNRFLVRYDDGEVKPPRDAERDAASDSRPNAAPSPPPSQRPRPVNGCL